jgi:CheY-like chemotaxis protein
MGHPDHILLVEDDDEIAEAILLILAQAGYEAVRAGNGQEALELVAQRMPALILLDMLMPVMDGWAFCREFRARYGPSTPIVVVTAAERAHQRPQEIGADGWLSKPFDIQNLLHSVVQHYPSMPSPPRVLPP